MVLADVVLSTLESWPQTDRINPLPLRPSSQYGERKHYFKCHEAGVIILRLFQDLGFSFNMKQRRLIYLPVS